jgi:hypothetical protein
MWHLPRELEDHFEIVTAKRSTGRMDLDDDDEEPSYMMQNAYAKGRGRYAR